MALINTFKKDKLEVKIMDSRDSMGKVAAKDAGDKIKELIIKKGEINMVFAAAPSQNEVLKYLVEDKEISWDKVNAFHMDEYLGLDPKAPQNFGNFLKDKIFSKVPFKNVYYINDANGDKEETIKRYKKLLEENHIDIIVLGVGENGHIAFNDPHVADFNDKELVKEVTLDNMCRMQQVNDGCFEKIDDVPLSALTLTIPALFNADHLFCVVPASTKKDAVYNMINGEINVNCPASILRTHNSACLYLDPDSSIRL